MQINGAGATFPAPIYTKWFSEYNKLHPNVQINYQPLGSGAGIKQITSHTVFFGASDGPMTQDQLLAAPGKSCTSPPSSARSSRSTTCPASRSTLKFTGPVLADIFLGKITKWNDPAIDEAEPRRDAAGHADIAVAHRSDGSGTTYIWCDYLAKVSPEWKKKVGVATSVNWPTGVAAAQQRRRRRHRHADAGRDRLRRADLRAAEQDQLRQCPEHERQSSSRPRSNR